MTSHEKWIHFQFPLWDTDKDTLDWIKKVIHFQFPLWDTFLAQVVVKLKHNFQFPLWDTPIPGGPIRNNLSNLSIPFMGYSFIFVFILLIFLALAFNSLYGILNISVSTSQVFVSFFQFPLWDTQKMDIHHMNKILNFQFPLWDTN